MAAVHLLPAKSGERFDVEVEIAPHAASRGIQAASIDRALRPALLRLPKVLVQLKIVVLAGSEVAAAIVAGALAIARVIECTDLVAAAGVSDGDAALTIATLGATRTLTLHRGNLRRMPVLDALVAQRTDKVKDLMRQALTTPATTVRATLDDALPSL